MHVLFVHQNHPAQFGHIAAHLVREHGFRCTFVSRRAEGEKDGVRLVRYRLAGGPTKQTHPVARPFEQGVCHAQGVFDACRRMGGPAPDLIVGHSGFGSTLFLGELFPAPVVNYFEYFYRPHDSDLDFRPEFPPRPVDRLRGHGRNAMILLDLESCRAGYSPTRWQRDRLPEALRSKVEVIFDGVDPAVWHPQRDAPRTVGGRAIPPGTRIVTYVARGLEAMRGFDVFLRVARRVALAHPDVLFVVVGADQVAYGADLRYTGGTSFREFALAQDDYDLSRFVFLGTVPAAELARLFSLTDAHVYLTVPFVLSWSLFDALACGAVVVASAQGPVTEVVEAGVTGLVADFYDADGLADHVLAVLRDPAGHRALGEAGARLVAEHYTLPHVLPRMVEMYRRVVAGARP